IAAAEIGSLLVEHAEDGERNVVDSQLLADGILSRKQLALQRLADHADLVRPGDIAVGEELAGCNRKVADEKKVGANPLNDVRTIIDVAAHDLNGADSNQRARGLDRRAFLGNRLGVLAGESLISPLPGTTWSLFP